MLSPRWRKVLRDLWRSKSRTILIVLSVAAGVFSVGVILNTQYILSSGFDRGFDKTHAASASIETETFDETLLQSIRALPGVTDVDGKHVLMTRLSTAPGEWSNIEVTAVSNFETVRINRFEFDSGVASGDWGNSDRAFGTGYGCAEKPEDWRFDCRASPRRDTASTARRRVCL